MKELFDTLPGLVGDIARHYMGDDLTRADYAYSTHMALMTASALVGHKLKDNNHTINYSIASFVIDDSGLFRSYATAYHHLMESIELGSTAKAIVRSHQSLVGSDRYSMYNRSDIHTLLINSGDTFLKRVSSNNTHTWQNFRNFFNEIDQQLNYTHSHIDDTNLSYGKFNNNQLTIDALSKRAIDGYQPVLNMSIALTTNMIDTMLEMAEQQTDMVSRMFLVRESSVDPDDVVRAPNDHLINDLLEIKTKNFASGVGGNVIIRNGGYDRVTIDSSADIMITEFCIDLVDTMKSNTKRIMPIINREARDQVRRVATLISLETNHITEKEVSWAIGYVTEDIVNKLSIIGGMPDDIERKPADNKDDKRLIKQFKTNEWYNRSYLTVRLKGLDFDSTIKRMIDTGVIESRKEGNATSYRLI